MYEKMQKHLQEELAAIKEAGLYKDERIIVTPQKAEIKVKSGQQVLNFCANNYLGLSASPQLIKAAKKALDERGYGMSSVRFICGTQDLHKELEARISAFFGTEDKAKRYRYGNADMIDLEEKLKEAQSQRFRIIATDGVFSMDGNAAPLDKILELAEKYDALVMVDESHSAGVVGKTGRGLTEVFNCRGKVDIITGTLGKAFGGAIGGFTTGHKEIIELLRQRSRPYLFSNSIPPMIVAASIRMFDILEESNELPEKLHENVNYFVNRMKEAHFEIKPTQSAICAVMLYDARLSQEFAAELLEEGIYVTGFSYPVVPKGEARIRVQISAGHEREHLDKAIAAFIKVGKKLNVIK